MYLHNADGVVAGRRGGARTCEWRSTPSSAPSTKRPRSPSIDFIGK